MKAVELSFGTSGLRGLVTDMTDLECYINAKAFIAFLAARDKKLSTIYLAGDLRTSTPRIMRAVAQAITDSGLRYKNCGLIPTPALAYYAQAQKAPGIMVTGSHIPANRNGIKFYKTEGEVLKSDEQAIKQAVMVERQADYGREGGAFDNQGQLVEPAELAKPEPDAARLYVRRYLDVFDSRPLGGKKIVMYQHSAVGRDIIPEILEDMGANVTCVGRSETFVPIDTENVTKEDAAYFKKLATEHPGSFAIVSTDGDSDRPFLIDETGTFHRGDILGLPTTQYLNIEAAALPISSNDAVLQFLEEQGIRYKTTRIGSPYVIEAMNSLGEEGALVAAWEVNGGYLLGSDIELNKKTLKQLPTRDALLPIVCALLQAIVQNKTISQLFAEYPKRYTQAGMLDDFPQADSDKITKLLQDSEQAKKAIREVTAGAEGYVELDRIDTTDGARMIFVNNDIMHIRSSGNAPQLRVYSNADSQARADDIVHQSIQEPDGILRKLQTYVQRPDR